MFFTSPAISIPVDITGGSGGPPDPNYFNVRYLLGGRGSNNSTTIIDNSLYGFGSTPTNVVVTTADAKFGTGCLEHTAGYVRSAGSTALRPDTNENWTIEMYLKVASYPPIAYGLFTIGNGAQAGGAFTGAGALSLLVYYSPSGAIGLEWNDGSASPPFSGWFGTSSLDTWNHLAFSYTGSSKTLQCFINGTQVMAPVLTGFMTDNMLAGTQITVGRIDFDPAAAQYPLTGKTDNFTFTRGITKYTSNFTPA